MRRALMAGALLALSSTSVRADDTPVADSSQNSDSVDPDAISSTSDVSVTLKAWITFYVQAGLMNSGEHTRPGVAACSRDLAFHTRLRLPGGREVVCLDRGRLGYGNPSWVDVFAPSYSWGVMNVARMYGSGLVPIEVLQ